MPKLIVNPGTDQSWEIPLPDGTTILGSNPASPFAIAHETVAPAHCEINVTNGTIRLRDLGSPCGTFVDHAPVTACSVAPGQSIQLGEVELSLASDGLPSATPPRRSYCRQRRPNAKCTVQISFQGGCNLALLPMPGVLLRLVRQRAARE